MQRDRVESVTASSAAPAASRSPSRTIAVDYDGTITEEDLLQRIAYEFGDPAAVGRLDRELDEGSITLRQEIVGEYATVRASLQDVLAWTAERTRIRPGFPELIELARERGWALIVVSSGFEELIRPLLGRAGIDVTLHANRVDPRSDGWVVDWRYDDDCEVCGQSCKRSTVLRLAQTSELVYIGDGYSDRCAGETADRVFATRGLARYLEQNGRAYEPFDDFFDVAAALTANAASTTG